MAGSLARIVKYVRASNRCPANDFLDCLDGKMRKKISGQFDALTKMGSTYVNDQRFRPLHGRGKPLWEFKEHDHRLYCFRSVIPGSSSVVVVLFSGWVKQKAGRSGIEDREIEKAMSLYNEFLSEFPGGQL